MHGLMDRNRQMRIEGAYLGDTLIENGIKLTLFRVPTFTISTEIQL